MNTSEISIIGRLDKDDKEKVSYFIRLLLKKSKYQALKKELAERRQEIESDETLSHEEIWGQMNV
ncbi:MAG: hypothetical protein D3914_07200 [Candidatus Electrothrix sp. LOE2]|jgi:hypothetical protein|nr:hypothetical protein [Candidatus Electrothrix sp. LOE2]